MNRKILFVIIAFVLLGASGFAYIAMQSDEDMVENMQTVASANEQPVAESPPTTNEPTPTAPSAQPGTYITYTATSLADTSGKRVLFFHAPWCPQCRSIEAGIKQGPIPDDLTIIKVDYDSNQSLRQKYGVTLQTTFVTIDESENKLALYVAYDEPTFDSVKRNFLNQ